MFDAVFTTVSTLQAPQQRVSGHQVASTTFGAAWVRVLAAAMMYQWACKSQWLVNVPLNGDFEHHFQRWRWGILLFCWLMCGIHVLRAAYHFESFLNTHQSLWLYTETVWVSLTTSIKTKTPALSERFRHIMVLENSYSPFPSHYASGSMITTSLFTR